MVHNDVVWMRWLSNIANMLWIAGVVTAAYRAGRMGGDAWLLAAFAGVTLWSWQIKPPADPANSFNPRYRRYVLLMMIARAQMPWWLVLLSNFVSESRY